MNMNNCIKISKDISSLIIIHCFIGEELIEKIKNKSTESYTGHILLNKLEGVCLLDNQ